MNEQKQEKEKDTNANDKAHYNADRGGSNNGDLGTMTTKNGMTGTTYICDEENTATDVLSHMPDAPPDACFTTCMIAYT